MKNLNNKPGGVVKTMDYLKALKRGCFILWLSILCVNVQAQEFDITSITPAEGSPGQVIDVVVIGTEFLFETEFYFGDDITVTNSVYVSTTQINLTLSIDASAPLGLRDVIATRLNGDGGILVENAFNVIKGNSPSVGAGLADTTLITTGAALVDGEVWIWGFRGSAQQGNGVTVVAMNAPPAKVESLGDRITQLVGGAYHLLALDKNGDVYGWGQSIYGETGCPQTYVNIPCKVISDAVQIAAGEYISVALDKSGQVWTWGHNLYGQLGNGGTRNSSIPVQVYLNGEKARLIGGAYEGGFAVTEEGHVWGWGDNEASGLGIQGPNYGVQRIIRSPVHIPNLDKYAADIVHIAGGNGWGEALLNDGRVIGWGLRSALGLGVRTEALSSPEPVVIMDKVVKLFARYVGSMALTEDGYIYTWGQTSGSAFPMIYGHNTTLHWLPFKPTQIGGAKENLYYLTADRKLYGVGYNDLFKLDQSRCCGPWIEWPGSEITLK